MTDMNSGRGEIPAMPTDDLRRHAVAAGLIDHYLEADGPDDLLLILADWCEDHDDPRRHTLRALHAARRLATSFDLPDDCPRLAMLRQDGYRAVMDDRLWPYRHRFRHDSLTPLWYCLCVRHVRAALPDVDAARSRASRQQRQLHGPPPRHLWSLAVPSARRLLAWRELAGTGVLGFDSDEVLHLLGVCYAEMSAKVTRARTLRLLMRSVALVDADFSRLTPLQALCSAVADYNGLGGGSTNAAAQYTGTWCNRLAEQIVGRVVQSMWPAGERRR